MGFFSAFLFVFIWWWEGFSSSWFKMSVSWSSQSQSQLYPFGPLCYMPVFWNFTLEPFQGGSVSNTRFWANSIIAWKICCRLSYVRDGGWSGGRVMWKCWVNVQCRGVLLIWIMVGQGPVALAVVRVEVVWAFVSRLSFLFFLPLSGRRPDIDWNIVWKGC